MEGLQIIESIQITQQNIKEHKQTLFDILADNMAKIALTENSREEDFLLWSEILRERLLNGQVSIISFLYSGQIIGYFQYSICNDVFVIEEIEISPPFQIRYNVLGNIVKLLPDVVPPNIDYIEAYANKNNNASTRLLDKVGFEIVGENKSGKSYLHRGKYSALAKQFKI